ncbi:MAG: hypothetical protein ACJ8J7_16205 [Sulfurifustaceae bacterium]
MHSPLWEDATYRLKGAPNVIDVRNMGIMAGIELAPKRRPCAYEVFVRCCERGLVVRQTGDITALLGVSARYLAL